MKEQQELEIQKTKWEIKKLKKENVAIIVTIVSLIIGLVFSRIDSQNIKKMSIPNVSKSNQLIPHTTRKIRFKNRDKTTAVEFWYNPMKNKNQGYKLRILKNHYILISASNEVDLSILDNKGDFVPLVSFTKLGWVFQANSDNDYTIVIGGENKSEILINIPPLTGEENIMKL